jgi:hypothetical protein
MINKLDNVPVPRMGRNYNQEEADRKIQEYIASHTIYNQSPSYADLTEFFPVFQEVIRIQEEEDKVPKGKELLVLEEDPPESIDTESITWSLLSRKPGQFNRGAHGESKIKEVTSHIRAIVDHPDNPSEKIVSMGKFYDNYIEFNIYARNSKAAMNRVIWLEKVIDAYRWYFRLNGFNLIEDSVLNKEQVIIDKLKLVKYPVIYYVRTEDIYHITTQELKRILVKPSVF